MERTLIILKPDAVQRRLSGAILERFERKGLRIAAMKLMSVGKALAERHYAVHRGKPFYESLIRFITSGPVVVLVLEGNHAVAVTRRMLGRTFGHEAEPGTIRGDFGISNQFNLVHGSDSPETAREEIALYFGPGEVLDYAMVDDRWLASE
ncbi:MAG: nucleoside-diphosphate kinase [Planctomycetes bacterium]|nr:nucleoside-diphosphate kinase [Planctomycetota bacterium]